ncbi:MAG: hypothetical protein NDJ94_18385 [Vicinamibacteria bacterium]|nr:hypothetical protein [Vicinamibacteria bacterium]
MNLKNKASWLSAAGLGALLVTGSALPAAGQNSGQYGRERRIEGQRFTTMRALAHRLDEAAATAARGAGDTDEERSGRMRQRFLWAVDDFARQARSLHERLERYSDSPWDVADEVQALNQRANQVNRQLRGARAFDDTHQDWAEVVTTLGLMNRSLRGRNVSLPVDRDDRYTPFDERTRFVDGRHYDSDGPGYDRDGYVTGTSLRDFRRLASSLNVESIRLLGVAERRGRSNDQGDRAYADLRRFAQQASDLSRRSGDALNSREIGATVARMTTDARNNERSMRESGAQPRVEWAASILILEQMANAVPRS